MKTKILTIIFHVIFFGVLFLNLYVSSMCRELDHDESQFIAAASMMNKENLLPYRDFAFFQTPGILFIYSFMFKFSDNPLSMARTFSVICAFIIISLIYFHLFRKIKPDNIYLKFVIPIFLIVLMISTEVFTYSFGAAWNHSFPLLLSLISLLLFLKANDKNRNILFLLSGIFLGYASISRISFLTLYFPFTLSFILFENKTILQKIKYFMSFALGSLLGFAPAFWLYCLAPDAFINDVFIYHTKIDILYLQSVGYKLNFIDILSYLFKIIIRKVNIGILIVSIISIVFFLIHNKFKRVKTEIILLIIILLVLTLTNMTKHIFFIQYLYAPLPFIILLIFYLYKQIEFKYKTILQVLIIFFSLYTYINNQRDVWKMHKLANREKWKTNIIHETGKNINNLCKSEKILTLSPVFALEGGNSIYKEFISSPFVWRISEFADHDFITSTGIVTKESIHQFLYKNSPNAILTGCESGEDEFIEYAKSNHFNMIKFDKYSLYLKNINLKDK